VVQSASPVSSVMTPPIIMKYGLATRASMLASPAPGGPTYAANDLVRAARAGADLTGLLAPITGVGPDTFQDVLTLRITAPAAGFVLVAAAVAIENNGACTGFDCGVFVRLRHTEDAAISPYLVASADNANHRDDLASPTCVFPVVAGAQTFTLQLGRVSSGAPLAYFSPQATALFVPFGSTGASTLGSGEPAPSGDGHGGGRP